MFFLWCFSTFSWLWFLLFERGLFLEYALSLIESGYSSHSCWPLPHIIAIEKSGWVFFYYFNFWDWYYLLLVWIYRMLHLTGCTGPTMEFFNAYVVSKMSPIKMIAYFIYSCFPCILEIIFWCTALLVYHVVLSGLYLK